jgi:transposase
MLTLPSSVRVYIALDPINLHLSIDRLAGLVRRLGLDPTTGHLFVFVNRQKTHMKILFFDRSGFCMLYKRLERGPSVSTCLRQRPT